MNIPQQLRDKGIKYDVRDDGKMLRFMDLEENLGTVLQFTDFTMDYHFFDANGCVVSPYYLFSNLEETLAAFDKLLLVYYKDDSDRSEFTEYFKDWVPMEGV